MSPSYNHSRQSTIVTSGPRRMPAFSYITPPHTTNSLTPPQPVVNNPPTHTFLSYQFYFYHIYNHIHIVYFTQLTYFYILYTYHSLNLYIFISSSSNTNLINILLNNLINLSINKYLLATPALLFIPSYSTMCSPMMQSSPNRQHSGQISQNIQN